MRTSAVSATEHDSGFNCLLNGGKGGAGGKGGTVFTGSRMQTDGLLARPQNTNRAPTIANGANGTGGADGTLNIRLGRR